MNQKSQAFEEFLKSEQVDCFERKDFKDEDGTVVYRSYIQSPIGNMPLFVILDSTIYGVLRVVLGPEIVTADNLEDINRLLNRENACYKNFKLYVDIDDHSVYLDTVYMSTADVFEPGLLYALMAQVVDYIPHVVGELKEAFHLDGRFVSPLEQHAQEHFQERVAEVKAEMATHKKN
ncbi:hypothetical protein [Veillonella montpellierensis]|uniref:hypothetical protein n=1 Tax=Veillonella montpellierensis TaxID=187328 RepID=UPI0004278A19|nr:hypothetical protein [Veillonella montpellierensis]